MIFVDSSAWIAAALVKDKHHAVATTWIAENEERLVTSDYVLDEVLTLLRARGERARSIELGKDLFERGIHLIHWVSPPHVRAAWEVFEQFGDKNWSFTDCLSRVVMEDLGITRAFAFDQHFGQFGTVTVVP